MEAGWTDAHAHPHLIDGLEDVLERAGRFGVNRILANATHPPDWAKVGEVSRVHAQLIPQFGVHPWRSAELDENWSSELMEMLLRFPGAGVGEIGLDSKLTAVPMEVQSGVFRTQIDIANRLGRACTVHVVGAWPELNAVLNEVRPRRMLLHAFGGSAEQVKAFVLHPVWFSFGGAVIRQSNSEKLREAVRAVPEDRILLETDSPYQHSDDKEKRQEPAGLLRIAEAVAAIRGVPVDALRRQTERNVEGFL